MVKTRITHVTIINDCCAAWSDAFITVKPDGHGRRGRPRVLPNSLSDRLAEVVNDFCFCLCEDGPGYCAWKWVYD